MYSGTGTQVCASVPPPAYYGPPFHGVYPPVYANNSSYFAQPSAYQYSYQNAGNQGPVDHRFSHRTKNQNSMPNTGQPHLGLPVPPMNMPIPFPPYGGQFPFPPPPMPPYSNYHAVPQNGIAMNHFQHNQPPPPLYPPPPNQAKVKSERFHPYHQNNRQFRQSEQFHCGSCDKDFHTSDAYDKHVNEHVICGLEGCTFKAHPMIVEKHIAMQHRSGLFKRIVKGNSPEEIEKWIGERKKRFPTKDKIVEKQIQKEEMEKRGERYDDKRKSCSDRSKNPRESRSRQQCSFGMRGNKKMFGSKFHAKSDLQHRRPKNDASKRSPKQKETSKMPVDDFEYQRNLPPFRGIEYYMSSETNYEEHDYSGSDSEESSLNVPVRAESPDSEESSLNVPVCAESFPTAVEPRQPLNSLALIQGYDSSDDSDGADEQNAVLPSTNPNVPTLNEDNDSEPEECSSKLPLPEFILKDLVDLAVPVPIDKEDAKENSSEFRTSESVCDEAEADDVGNGSNCPKKLARKRRKNRSGKSDENDQRTTKNEKTNYQDDNTKRTTKNEETNCQDDSSKSKTTTLLPRKRYKPPTLLEKLLAPEIKHERNVILQCVRYVVNNNYFGIGSGSNDKSSATL